MSKKSKPEYDVRRVQEKMLGIMEAFDKVCREHGLKYFLVGGSMLGAVRHKGFIPWDDDADVAMPFDDYNRFLAHAAEWMPEQYEVVSGENSDDYHLPFAKIVDAHTTMIEKAHLHHVGGVYIDLFPLGGMPGSKWARKFHKQRYKWINKMLYFTCRDPYRHGHGPSSWVPLACHKAFTLKGLQRRITKVIGKYDYNKSRRVYCFDDPVRVAVTPDVYGIPKEYEFEGRKFYGVADADKYLSTLYGDYMTLPPEEDRFQHNFYYLDLDHPYRSFVEEDLPQNS